MTEEVAGLLKRTREEKGLSLKDTEAKTRIPFHYLQILEGQGNTRLLADILYLIPFLRAYSAFLGLDPALTVSQFVAAVQKGESQGPVSSPKPRRLFSRTLFVLVILAGLVVLSLLWISGESGG
jgi:cytoskeletal protein RodZ